MDVVTRGMLGVTVACARCHDHKYDPFTARDYYALAGVFASTAYKEYPLVEEEEASSWQKAKKDVDAAEKALNKFLDEQSISLAESFAGRLADYMTAANGGAEAPGLHAKVVDRWKAYLAKPEENHPFLKGWFANRTQAEAERFQALMLQIIAEKKGVDEENKRVVAAAEKIAPKVLRTIVLPGGYRSEEDFNPGAYIPVRSLERDRFVAWNRTFGEASAPFKFDRDVDTRVASAGAPRRV